MVAVVPTLAGALPPQRPPQTYFGRVRSAIRWLQRVVGPLPGEYTIAKLDDFDRFRNDTKPRQVAAILMMSPVACVLVNLLLESIPLANPAEGLRDSYAFLLRNFLTASTVLMTSIVVKLDCISRLNQSWKFILWYGFILGAVSTATIVVLSKSFGVFPVPSAQFSPMLPMGMVSKVLEQLFLVRPEIKTKLKKIEQWLAMDVAPIVVYPLFTALFTALKQSQQVWLSLLLPVIKLILRNFLWFVMRDDLDLVSFIICCVGHLYHVLFTAMCLQNAKSLETLGAVVFVNFVQMILNCREIMKGTRQIRLARARLKESPTDDIITMTLALTQNDRASRKLHHRKPSRLFSTYPRHQGAAFLARFKNLQSGNRNDDVKKIDKQARRESRRRSSLGSMTQIPEVCQAFYQILPVGDNRVQNTEATLPEPNQPIESDTSTRTMSAYASRVSSTSPEEIAIRSITSTLHHTEIILLRSFITVCATSLYGVYVIIIFWLPNRQYFATIGAKATFGDISTMAFHLVLLSGTESVFLAIYLLLIWRYLKVSGVYQLAFVLWSQRVLIQAKFVMLSLMILGFPLEHYGNGFIFNLHPAG